MRFDMPVYKAQLSQDCNLDLVGSGQQAAASISAVFAVYLRTKHVRGVSRCRDAAGASLCEKCRRRKKKKRQFRWGCSKDISPKTLLRITQLRPIILQTERTTNPFVRSLHNQYASSYVVDTLLNGLDL